MRGEWATLDFVVAEFGDDFGGGFLVATAPASPEGGAALGGAAGGGVAGPEAGGAGGLALALQHAVLGVGLGPVHGLLDVLLHAQPLLVTHGYAALPPLIVQGPLGFVAQGLLCFLWVNK